MRCLTCTFPKMENNQIHRNYTLFRLFGIYYIVNKRTSLKGSHGEQEKRNQNNLKISKYSPDIRIQQFTHF